METPKEFLVRKEDSLIKAVSEKEWLENKVYFPHEIIEFMEEYAANQKADIMSKFGLTPDGLVLPKK